MDQTNGDSQVYMVCMSTRKEKELEVIESGAKEANFLGVEIPLEDAKMQENDVLVSKKGTIKFPPKTYAALKGNRRDRKTTINRSKNTMQR